MAELKLTALQHRFFLAVLEGHEPVEAIKRARPPGSHQLKHATAQEHARRMMREPAVLDALARARARLAADVELTVHDLVNQLMVTRELAHRLDPPQLSAAVAATMGAAKLLGLVIDRAQVMHAYAKPSPVPTAALELSEEEWRRTFDPSAKGEKCQPERTLTNDK